MSNVLAKSDYKISGTFNKEEAEKFLTPLSDFLRVSGVSATLRFNQDKSIVIKAINDSKNVISFIEYQSTCLPNLKVTENCRASIFDLSEFVSLTKIFSQGFNLTYDDKEKYLELVGVDSEVEQSFKFYLADETAVNKAPEAVKIEKATWFANFNWDSKKYLNFIKGMSSLKQPFVIFEGKKGEDTLTMSVCENKNKSTTMKTKIKTLNPISDTFRLVLNKENFLNPVTCSVTNFEMGISEKFLSMAGTSPYHSVAYFVVKVMENE